jgi:prevent-host-death family protein
MRSVSASDFKAHCLNYVKLTHARREEFLITTHGKPMARLVPVELKDYESNLEDVFDKLKKYTVIHGNIIDPIDVPWDVLSE